jgi:hypothetical protein
VTFTVWDQAAVPPSPSTAASGSATSADLNGFIASSLVISNPTLSVRARPALGHGSPDILSKEPVGRNQ